MQFSAGRYFLISSFLDSSDNPDCRIFIQRAANSGWIESESDFTSLPSSPKIVKMSSSSGAGVTFP